MAGYGIGSIARGLILTLQLLLETGAHGTPLRFEIYR